MKEQGEAASDDVGCYTKQHMFNVNKTPYIGSKYHLELL